jgi:hypothetical protein
MAEETPTNIGSAFEFLLEEIEAEIEFMKQAGVQTLEGRDYDEAQDAAALASKVTEFRDRLVELRKEWDALAREVHTAEANAGVAAEWRNLYRLRREVRTPPEAYFAPILKAVHDLGGSARTDEVLSTAKQAMADMLKHSDDEPLTSDPRLPRWRNAAQWARYEMTKQDLLNADSPADVWEITEDGRRYLAQAGSDT